MDAFLGEKVPVFQDPPFFPFIFNDVKNYRYIGPCPELSFFLEPTDSPETSKDKTAYVRDYTNPFDFKKELQVTLLNEVFRIKDQALEILNFSHDLQKHLKDELGEKVAEFNIFQNCSTISSFGDILQQYYCLTQFPIYVVRNTESGVDTAGTSQPEYILQMYLKKIRPHHKFRASFLSSEGPMRFKNCIPDIVDLTAKEAIWFNVCWVHQHGCHLSKDNKVIRT